MNARDLALVEIDRRKLPGWPSNVLPAVRTRSSHSPDDPRDVALAEHITIGATKNLLHLRYLLQHHAGRPLKRIDPLVAKITVIGLYQLRFMQRIPASAAVDEAVEQTRRLDRSRAAGFVNVVLRNATRNPDPSPPDAQRDPQAYASLVLSHPVELYRRLSDILNLEDALAQCARNNREPPTIVRMFKGVSIEQLAAPGVTITPHAQDRMYIVDGAKRSTLEDIANRGLAQVQDVTSAQVVSYLDVHPGQRLLDRCSGLGTKTLQMRDVLGADGEIVAIDPSRARMAGLRRLLDARGIVNVSTHQVSMLSEIPSIAPASFDRALLDVPCSNSGVLARRAEARYAQDDRTIESLVKLQREILLDTAPYVAPGGLLVYSTCTIWPDENERQVEWFARQRGDYELLDSKLTLPSRDEDPRRYHDGGFVAVLRRRSA